jgi:hypothetical protein
MPLGMCVGLVSWFVAVMIGSAPEISLMVVSECVRGGAEDSPKQSVLDQEKL